MKLLLYCCKTRPYLFKTSTFPDIIGKYYLYPNNKYLEHRSLNGKIIGECDFELEEIRLVEHTDWWDFETGTMYENELCRKSCLDNDELTDYLIAYGKVVKHYGYAIHIKNLKVFDKPRELYELKSLKMFNQFTEDLRQAHIDDAKISERIAEGYADEHECANNVELTYDVEYIAYGLKKAPQNMMWVFDGEEKKVLTSIHPEWLCKILNGEKTIEVRKKVLKEML